MAVATRPVVGLCCSHGPYQTWLIIETNVTDTDTWELTNLPPVFTVTLFEALLTTGAAGATAIDPELHTGSPFDPLVENSGPGTKIRNVTDVRVISPDRKLLGKSMPSGGNGIAVKVTTRITLREGH